MNCGSVMTQRAWDPLLVRLFPEVSQVWSADASQVANAALQAPTKRRRVEVRTPTGCDQRTDGA